MSTQAKTPGRNRLWNAVWELPRALRRRGVLAQHLFHNEALWTTSQKSQIAVLLRGGLGDVMIAARWLNALLPLLAARAEIAVDLYYALPENIVCVVGRLPHVRYIYHDLAFEHVRRHYDFSFVLNHLGYLEMDEASAPAGVEALPYRDVVESWAEGVKTFSPFTTSDYHPDLGKDFYSLIRELTFTRSTILEAQTGIAAPIAPYPFLLPEAPELARYEALRGPYITLHDGWDAQLRMGRRRPTKTYPQEKWAALAVELKRRLPHVALVQLGGAAGERIPAVDLDLKGAVDLAVAARVLEGACLHIDTDSGLVHIAASLGVRAVVLYGPTDIAYYGYPQNLNLNAAGCNNCWLKTGNWAARCMVGHEVPVCMDGIAPARVADAATAILSSARRGGALVTAGVK